MNNLPTIIEELGNPDTIVLKKRDSWVDIIVSYYLRNVDTNTCKKRISNWDIITKYYKWKEKFKVVKFRIRENMNLFPQVFQLLHDRSGIGSNVKFVDSC